MGVVDKYKNPEWAKIGPYEFENGALVKINGMRPEHMSGDRLIKELRDMAKLYSAVVVRMDVAERRLSDAGWAETARQQERSGGTM